MTYATTSFLTLTDIRNCGILEELDSALGETSINQITLSAVGSLAQYGIGNVDILGWLDPHHVVVSYPRKNGSLLTILKNQVLEGRQFTGKEFRKFTAEVVGMAFAPVPYLILGIPSDSRLEITPLRSAVRRTLNSPVVLTAPHGVNQQGICSDISGAGALVVTSACPFESGLSSEVELMVALPYRNKKISLEIPAQILRQEPRKIPQGKVYLLGIKFLKKSDLAELALDAFIGLP